MCSYENLTDEIIDISDEDLTDQSSGDSEDECVTSENELESSGDDEPLRKIQRTENLSTIATNAGNLVFDLKDYDDSTSTEEDSEDVAAPDGVAELTWNDVTGVYLKHFPYNAVNTGVSVGAIEELTEKSPYDFFKYFITNDIINYMVVETNRYALQKIQKEILPNQSRLRKWKEVDILEMEKFLGILLWMGLNRMPKMSNYWSKSPLYSSNIKNVMSRNKFALLLRVWHFSDNEKCPANNPLFKIQPFVDILLQRFQKAIVPQKEVYIDETRVPLTGRLTFKNQHYKFGIKLFKLCIKDGYTYNIKICCGTEAKPGSSVVMTLMRDLLDSGRILYTDNIYTSVHLAHQLLARSTYLVGTLRSNRILNPKEVISANLSKGQQVARESNTGVVVLKWKDRRDVLMLSTIPTDNRNKVQGGKPEIIVQYNNYKAYIDLSDQMKSYSTALRRIKWFRKLAVELITGSALVNSYVLYTNITGKKISITQFKEEVTLKLLHIEETSVNIEPTPECALQNMGSARRRCVVCYVKLKNERGRKYATSRCKKSAYKCIKCNSCFCVECFFVKHVSRVNI